MHNVYWMYNGYSGDVFGFAERNEKLAAKFAPQGKSTLVRCFSWLNQLGFGPGYYNNSGVYFLFQRSTFKTPELGEEAVRLMRAHYAVTVYETEADYKKAIELKRLDQRDMRKRHPY